MNTRPNPGIEMAQVFASLSGVLLSEQTVETALATITSLAVDTIAGTSGSGISLLNAGGERITWAATHPQVGRLDALQYELDEGPCLTAWHEQTIVRSGDLAGERRWPAWSSRVAEQGMRSVLSAPLTTVERTLGAIKVYSTVADAYGERDEDILRRFADQAAIFVSNVQTVEAARHVSDRLKETLHFRDLIATARGVVMSREGLDADDAYRHLMTLSYRARLPVREVAERIVNPPEMSDSP